jgi:hypothetical protein
LARRVGLPEHIRAELPARANAGVGHDADYPTRVGDQTVPAQHACRMNPSAEMLSVVREVTGFLRESGAAHIEVAPDLRGTGQPGAITVRWMGDVPARIVAEKFAVSAADDGTPRVPAWLNLRSDSEFDLRWQPPY